MALVLGTAGHIDHGKTSLVRALTGIDCDRLEEEKRRGITIELGFAWAELPDGERLGIVDVPGHERFVKNMVAGAAGVDFVMLVIAADEGVMPQTREHLDICTLLGITRGFVALTKIDMVDAQWLELVQEDVRTFLKGSFLEHAPIFPVSSVTGEGLDALRAYIHRCAAGIPPRRPTDLFRLPIDRVFGMKGHGTVVTGTVISGSLESGEELVAMPEGVAVRARALQRHGEAAEVVRAGQRCAVNVQGTEMDSLHRGQVLARPGSLFPSRRWLLQLICLPSAPRALRQRTEVHFHHGTQECAARVVFFDRDRLAPGESCLAELRFSQPLAGVFGDHCVIRAYSPLRTVAGGSIVSPLPPELRARDPRRAHNLETFRQLAALATPAHLAEDGGMALVLAIMAIRHIQGCDVPTLQALSGLPAPQLHKLLVDLASRGKLLCWNKEQRQWIDGEAFTQLMQAACARAAELHRKHPLKPSHGQGAICAGWSKDLPPRLVQRVLESAVKKGLLVQEGDGLRLPSHTVSLAGDQQGLRQKLLAAHEAGGMAPPNLKDVLAELGVSQKEAAPVLRLLCEEKALVRVADGLYYAAAPLEEILSRTRQWFAAHDDLDLAGLKEITGLSRKFLIALLEYMDREKITVRVGDARHLRSRQPS
ncbi:selenocysteine-specific translation elongation factor [uncultured Desulfovibrio sp.]|uniref:selenocysteine-specific translation elongation factor n=1 Tax=uncultured Desulfovibrio sp. TaxID=167968 RepID=UPI003207A3D2